jgi:hypothetical protein
VASSASRPDAADWIVPLLAAAAGASTVVVATVNPATRPQAVVPVAAAAQLRPVTTLPAYVASGSANRGGLPWIRLAALGLVAVIVVAVVGNMFQQATTGMNSKPGSYTVSLSSSPEATQAAAIPAWLLQLRNNPIQPGVGMAGVKLGDSERSAIDTLGDASIVPEAIKDTNGNVLDYGLRYSYQGVFLGIFTSPGTRVVQGIRLYDDDFNSLGYIPTARGVTIGEAQTQLVNAFGQPNSTMDHFTCPSSLTDRSTTTYTYQGISFWVCNANSLVYLMDIP